MWTSIKLMLAGGMSVKENDGARDVKWNGKFGVFNGKRDSTIEGVVLNRDAIEPKLILIEESTEVEMGTGRSYSVIWCTWWLKHKGKSQDSALLHGEDIESCYEQTVSWNNETSLWLKSECIHEYICDKDADAFPFVIHISDVVSYCS